MATEQQIAANRLNAQRSSGPKTEEGKKRSSMNPLRHGFVFSTSEIHAVIDRKQRLQLALTTDFSKFEPGKFQGQAA